MRKSMANNKLNEELVLEEKSRVLNERTKIGTRLLEKYQKRPFIREGLVDLYNSNPNKAIGLAIALRNQENHLKSLTETQVSSSFATTPENVMRIIRLGYPNSVRGDIFHEWNMVTAHDSIWYVDPIYQAASRGTTANGITHKDMVNHYFSEVETQSIGSGDGTTRDFTTSSLTYAPARTYSIRVVVEDASGYSKIVGNDDGAGNISGSTLSSGSITYSTGDVAIQFANGSEPTTGETVKIEYSFDSENSTLYSNIKSIELRLRDYQFRAKPHPLYISWSKMSELYLGTLDINAEEELIRNSSELLKQTLDYEALKLGYQHATAQYDTGITFDADFANAGADSEEAHYQSISRYIEKAGDLIYSANNRGGVTKIYAGTDAIGVFRTHRSFQGDNSQPPIGAHKVGNLNGIDVFKVPNDIVPTNEAICVYRDVQESSNVALAFGTLVPLYTTQTLEFKEAYKTTGLYQYGDWKALNPSFMTKITMTNIP